jgi:hypothetical protein
VARITNSASVTIADSERHALKYDPIPVAKDTLRRVLVKHMRGDAVDTVRKYGEELKVTMSKSMNVGYTEIHYIDDCFNKLIAELTQSDTLGKSS